MIENEIAFEPVGELPPRLTARLQREHRGGIYEYSFEDRADPEEDVEAAESENAGDFEVSAWTGGVCGLEACEEYLYAAPLCNWSTDGDILSLWTAD